MNIQKAWDYLWLPLFIFDYMMTVSLMIYAIFSSNYLMFFGWITSHMIVVWLIRRQRGEKPR